MNMPCTTDIVTLEQCSTVKHTYRQINPWNVNLFFFNPRQGPGAALSMLEGATLLHLVYDAKGDASTMLDKSVALPKMYPTTDLHK